MNLRRILHITSGLFLIAAISCTVLALMPSEPGVRIPVHAANGKIGYIDHRGRMVIAPVWDSATPFGSDDHARVSATRQVGKMKVAFDRWVLRRTTIPFPRTQNYRIDRAGNLTLLERPALDLPNDEPPTTDSGEMTRVQRGSVFRWILDDGSPAFPGSWQQAMDFRADDLAAVLENGRWGFINRKGETALPFRWDKTLGFDGHGRACVAIGWKWGVIDREGNLVVPLRFTSLAGFDDKGFCAAELASGSGFIGPNGKIEIPFRYRKVESFDRFGMAQIQLASDRVNPFRGWIDRSGKTLVPPHYEVNDPVWAPNFADHELLPVIESGKAGLIDRKGRTVIANAHGELASISDPKAPGKFWITTLPYRSFHSPDGKARPPFQPACYDSEGSVIWSGNILTPAMIQATVASLFGLVAMSLFLAGKRHSKRHTHQDN